MIILAKKDRDNKKVLAMENIIKIRIAEITIPLSAINFENRYSWAINNDNIDAVGDLRLTSYKKYWRCTGQIHNKVDKLEKNKILAFAAFV